ncbi:MAG: carbon-nitrogen family hydrolase [Ignavibacteriales bacterium]
MKIAFVQYNPEWESKETNRDKLDQLLEKNQDNYSLIIFPEMTLTGFTMDSSQFSEGEDGETCRYFRNMAQKYDSDIIAGFIENDMGKIYNTLIHLDKNGILVNKYRKIHPFSYSGEDVNYCRGDKPVVTRVENMNIGLSVCYDLRFPELFRHYAKARAELIVVIANWPVKRIEHWKTLLRARAIENQCYVVGVNRVGNDPGNQYNGFSSLISPMGEEIVSAMDKETVLKADISADFVNEVRAKLPFLKDMTLL